MLSDIPAIGVEDCVVLDITTVNPLSAGLIIIYLFSFDDSIALICLLFRSIP